jgi:hypothetical protein
MGKGRVKERARAHDIIDGFVRVAKGNINSGEGGHTKLAKTKRAWNGKPGRSDAQGRITQGTQKITCFLLYKETKVSSSFLDGVTPEEDTNRTEKQIQKSTKYGIKRERERKKSKGECRQLWECFLIS